MNRKQAIDISEKVKLALKKIQEEEKLEFEISQISFNPTQLKFIILASSSDNIEKLNLTLSKKYGFTQNIIGMEFSCKLGNFKIESFAVKNRKYPIIARRIIDSRQYKFESKNILKYLGGNSIVNRNANLKNLLD